MGLTTFKQVLVAALAGALLAAVMLNLFDIFEGFPPVVPWSVPAVLVVMAVACLVYARGLRQRISDGERVGVVAVRALVVAKSGIMTGAVLAGMHAVYVGRWVGELPAPTPTQRVILGSVTLVASLLLTAAGHVLEKACLVPDDEDPEAGGGEAA